jgi:type IV pilus assembly protein PilM
MAAAHLERIDADFRTATELQAANRFDEAMLTLAPIAKNEHPRMAERAARAKHLLQQLGVLRSQRRAAAQQTKLQAAECFEAFEYDEAARLLDDIAPAFRNVEIEELRTKVAARREEIDVCAGELREAVQQKRLADLPVIIERLMVLKPDHPLAKNVAEQMQRRLVAAAESQLARFQYDESLKLLDQIDFRVRSHQTVELRRQVAELACLMNDLRMAPAIDKTLVAEAERLRTLAANDPRVAKLCIELRNRLRQAGSQENGATWAKPPKQTPLHAPVDGLAGFQRMTCASGLDRSELQKNAGRFAVACGLALGGLGQGSLRFNLQQTQKQGVLRRVTRLMRSDISVGRKAWGVDLGVSGLKAIKLSWHAPQQAVVEGVAMIEHAKPLNQAANEIEQKGLIADTIRAFLETHQPKTDPICIGMPGRMALARYVELPAVKDAKARKLVQFEAPHQFPVPLERLEWDFQILDDALPSADGSIESDGLKRRRALLIGAQQHSIDRFIESFRLLGIGVDVLQPDFIALHNFIAYEMFGATGDGVSAEQHGAIATIDVGADVTNLIVSLPQSVWFHSCGVGGHSFSRALVREWKYSLAQAEQFKREPESAERLSDLYEAMSPVFEDFMKEVQQALSAYAQAHPHRPVERVLGAGGGFALHGLLRYLRFGR